MKNASILFYSLTLMFFLITGILVMVFLFTIQVDILRIMGEGNNAYYAAQSGVENARNKIYNKNLAVYNCNGIFSNPGSLSGDFITYGPLADTFYLVSYSFICETIIPDYPDIIYTYNLTNFNIQSWGTFGDARREIIITRDQL